MAELNFVKENLNTLFEQNISEHITSFKNDQNGLAPLCLRIDGLIKNLLPDCEGNEVLASQINELIALFRHQINVEEGFLYAQGYRDAIVSFAYLDREHAYKSLVNTGFEDLIDND